MKSGKKRWVFIAAIVIIVAGALWFFFAGKKNTAADEYKTAQVTRGDVQVTVSSTGSLAAEDTVEVGTEISGTVKTIYVDYNQHVKKGQVLARLKTDLLAATVQDAEATVAKCRSDVEEAQINFNRNKTLFDKGYLAEKDFLPFKAGLTTAQSSLISAQATLSRAKTNLGYTVIKSPIEGIVLERAVEVGQTVAASFSTPTLFIIAKDLSKMRIKALVDESDISQIKKDQNVTFTVTAYPDKVFAGKVVQIRRQSTMVSNVVNYTVIVSADNRDNLLFPGMTTTIDFIVNQVHDALLVPNAALKFKPDKGAFHGKKRDSNNKGGDSTRIAMRAGRKHMSPDSLDALLAAKGLGLLWTYDEQKNIKPIKVKIILAGDSTTAVESDKLQEGMTIISGRVMKKNNAAKPPAGGNSSSRNTPRMFM